MQSVRSQTIVKAHLLNLFCNVFAPFLGRGLKLGWGGEKLRAPLGIRRCYWKSRNFSPSRSHAARRDVQAVPVNDGSFVWRGRWCNRHRSCWRDRGFSHGKRWCAECLRTLWRGAL